MNRILALRDDRGFTIQELMVVLIVGGLLLSFAFSLFLFSHKIFYSWQRKTDVETSVTHALNVISLDVLQSKLILEVTDTSLALIKKSDARIRYRFDGKHIWRNQDLITPVNDVVHRMEISRELDGTRKKSILIRITGESNKNSFTSETRILSPQSSKAEFRNATL